MLRVTRLHRYNTHLIVLLHFEFLSHSKRAIPDYVQCRAKFLDGLTFLGHFFHSREHTTPNEQTSIRNLVRFDYSPSTQVQNKIT